MAGLQLASGVMLMVDYALERRQAKQLAADSLRAAELLTSLHLQDFPEPTAPVAPSPPRRLRRFGRIDRDDQAAVEAAYAKDLARWELLCGHDPDEVIATVDDALADNASQSTCIDAGSAPTGNYVTVVVQYPGPEITEGIVQVGTNTRPRSEKERTTSTDARSPQRSLPALKKRWSAPPPLPRPTSWLCATTFVGGSRNEPRLDAIYVGALNRSVLGMNWKLRNPVEVITGARDVRINLDRKGRFKPLGDDAGSDLRALVAAVAAVALAAQVGEYGEIECDVLSAKYAVFVIMLSPNMFRYVWSRSASRGRLERRGAGRRGRAYESGHIHIGVARASGDGKVCAVTGHGTVVSTGPAAAPRRVGSQLYGVDLQRTPRH